MRSSAFFMKHLYIIPIVVLFLHACKTPDDLVIEHQKIAEFDGSSIRGISIGVDGSIWISGSKGLVAVSENAGEYWESVKMPDQDSLDYRSIITPGSGEVIVASAGFPARIYRSVDGGTSWTLSYENLDSAAFINTLLFNETYDLYFAFGDILEGRHLLLKSEDHGGRWERVTNIPPPEPGENGFAASNACMTFHHNKIVIGLGGESARMLMSQNLGEDWQFTPTPRKNLTDYEGVYALATNKKKLVAVGGDFSLADQQSEVLWSSDGLNWKLSGGQTNGYRSSVVYNAHYGLWFAVGSNGIDISETAEVWKKASELDLNVIRNAPSGKWLIAANGKGEVFKITVKERQHD